MKRPIAILISLCFAVAVLCLSVFAAGRSFDIKTPSGYTAVYSDGEKGEMAKKLNMTVERFEAYLKDNNIEYFAVSKDNKSQIKISVREDSFSQKTENLSAYSNKDIKKLAKELVDDTSLSFDIYKRNFKKYIRITTRSSDSGGDYTAMQFITIVGGKLYNISFLNSGKNFKTNDYEVLDTLKINAEKSSGALLIAVFTALGVAVFSAVIVIMVRGIFKDRKTED